MSDDLVVPVHFEVGQELCFCLLDHLLLVLLELELFVSRQGLPSRLYDVVWEMSELSLEPAIEGRFDASIFVVPSGVAKKYVDTFLEAPITSKEPAAVLSGQARTVRDTGPDGPRPGVRRWCSLVRRGRSAAQGRTVRDLAQELRFSA
jgi:hypothetical protein